MSQRITHEVSCSGCFFWGGLAFALLLLVGFVIVDLVGRIG